MSCLKLSQEEHLLLKLLYPRVVRATRDPCGVRVEGLGTVGPLFVGCCSPIAVADEGGSGQIKGTLLEGGQCFAPTSPTPPYDSENVLILDL